jgi:uncharacterized paraquat-inducible protein A
MARPERDDELKRLAAAAASETHKQEVEAGERDEPVYSLTDLREVAAHPRAGERGRRCPRCHTVVSPRRDTCDQCGYSLRRAPGLGGRRAFVWALLLAGAVALICALGLAARWALKAHSWAGQYDKALEWDER